MRRAASTAIQQLTRRPSVACQFNLFSSSHLLWLPDSQAGWAHSAEASHPESLEANANEDAFADFDFDDGAIAKGLSNFENKLFVDPKKVPAEAQSPASSPQTRELDSVRTDVRRARQLSDDDKRGCLGEIMSRKVGQTAKKKNKRTE
eukprot:GDKK01021870.1.p1 GENE.GDKK01021870.1~~GDKK01021870.1.p1  ORF type:complete len:148 (+),score=7.02 GDKK01021870.1:45-488(+)